MARLLLKYKLQKMDTISILDNNSIILAKMFFGINIIHQIKMDQMNQMDTISILNNISMILSKMARLLLMDKMGKMGKMD